MKKKKRSTGFFTKLILAINIFFAACLLVSYLAPVLDPQQHWVIAFFGLAYPPVLLVNLLFIVYWLFFKWWYAGLSLVCILAGYNILQGSFGFHAARDYVQKESREAIRVMTYNVHSFKKYGSDNDKSTKHEILDIIRERQPDILCFQEFYTRFKGEYALQDSIKDILNAHVYFEAFPKRNLYDAHGVAIFSKYPIIGKGVIKISEDWNPNQCIYVDIKKKDKIVRFYSVHFKSIGFDPEDYQTLDSVSQKGKTDMRSARRIGSKLKQAFKARSIQTKLVKDQLAMCPYPYVISGDFNDTPSSYAVHQMEQDMQNAFRVKGSGLGRTYNGDFPNYQIDYIMAGPGFNVLDYTVIKRKLSDHYPVYSDVLLK
ncbi:endonuclease/exonuclease/phosphatase family protein [Mucilaginibacter ginkgonis]|uniref:Endonuclease/exonuclease/phosphatase family protein n=1 Tax=Mucilaginibacter ginkgonis TaxID=2682091 RepID=A0A6I4HYA0_9SPHI|nr:endonuclease/exonuclease/phosphatase family protein [Mucilaginibacter ginkgonis]QQL49445.1 endonuclease/exonuclease/phosphatase family protein [Mucilaginibacter ginkgonis]